MIINELFEFDKKLKKTIIGTDEAGRGPGAGPVCAAAVYFPDLNDKNLALLKDLNDSKKLSEKKREELYEIIIKNSIYSIQFSSVEEIEKLNILQASLLAMKKACSEVLGKINKTDTLVLIDGNKLIKGVNFNQKTIVKGDSTSASIAAASILAKVTRDRLMKELHKEFPQYGWDTNKGYLTKTHIDAIFEHGITKWHRQSFVSNLARQKTLF